VNYKNIIQCGFVVICPSPNLGQLKTTISSLIGGYPNYSVVTVVPEGMSDLSESLCNSIGSTIEKNGSPAAQINVGIAKSPCNEWIFIIQAGSWVRTRIDIRFSRFVESEKDILFPVLKRKTNFVDADWSGTLIHKKAVEELGPFPYNNPEKMCKILWTIDAIEHGYKFKGIIGSCLR